MADPMFAKIAIKTMETTDRERLLLGVVRHLVRIHGEQQIPIKEITDPDPRFRVNILIDPPTESVIVSIEDGTPVG